MIKGRVMSFLLVAAAPGWNAYPQDLNRPDQRFVQTTAQSDLANVKFGQLAQERGASQTVKDFAARMVADHSRAAEQWKGIASSKNVNLPDYLSSRDQAIYDRLLKLSGQRFDREYMRATLDDHVLDVAAFRRVSQFATDPDVRDFATKALPTVEEHLKLAQDGTSKPSTSAAK
jgi:putative membrane protein